MVSKLEVKPFIYSTSDRQLAHGFIAPFRKFYRFHSYVFTLLEKFLYILRSNNTSYKENKPPVFNSRLLKYTSRQTNNRTVKRLVCNQSVCSGYGAFERKPFAGGTNIILHNRNLIIVARQTKHAPASNVCSTFLCATDRNTTKTSQDVQCCPYVHLPYLPSSDSK